jgi:hypothetical protein
LGGGINLQKDRRPFVSFVLKDDQRPSTAINIRPRLAIRIVVQWQILELRPGPGIRGVVTAPRRRAVATLKRGSFYHADDQRIFHFDEKNGKTWIRREKRDVLTEPTAR